MPGRVPNFVPTASYGGTHDHLIERYGLRWSKVVVAHTLEEAEQVGRDLGLEYDHDDRHAMKHGDRFLLLIHGSQPKGSEAGKAVYSLRKQGEYGYGRRADAVRAMKAVSRRGRHPPPAKRHSSAASSARRCPGRRPAGASR